MSYTDKEGEDADVVCSLNPKLPLAETPGMRVLQIVLMHTPLEQAVNEWYWKLAWEQPELGCREFVKGNITGDPMVQEPCKINVLPTEQEVAKWGIHFAHDAPPLHCIVAVAIGTLYAEVSAHMFVACFTV